MPGLEVVDQYPGHLEAQISLHFIFFLWGFISAIETVIRDMIQKTWQEIEFRLDISRATNSAHIEMY